MYYMWEQIVALDWKYQCSILTDRESFFSTITTPFGNNEVAVTRTLVTFADRQDSNQLESY